MSDLAPKPAAENDLQASQAHGPAYVTAIIPHWNRRGLLEQLLTNLQLQTRPFDRVLVVDNGSTDGSPELAEGLGATVIRLEHNIGFATAVNLGITAVEQTAVGHDFTAVDIAPDQATTQFVAILNNDVTLEPNWLTTVLEAIDSRGSDSQPYWFAAGKILSAKDHAKGIATIDGTWDEVSRAACAVRCGVGSPDGPLWNQPHTIRMAPMTALLLRLSLFRQVGYLDGEFVSYLEDVDFGLRCAEAGCAGVYQPKAVGYHLGSATLGAWNPDAVRLIARNQVLLAAKHFRSQPHQWRSAFRLLWGQGLWGLIALKHRCGFSYLRGKVAGVFAITRLAPRPANGTIAGSVGAVQIRVQQRQSIAAIVLRSERQIFEMQQRTGFDLYWRLYFLFGRPESQDETEGRE